MQGQIKPALSETLRRLLPPCSGCLLGFLDCVSLQPFPCGHFYCPTCLLKTKLTSNLYQCLHEQNSCEKSELNAQISPENVVNALIFATPPIVVIEDLKPFLGLVDLEKVPCKDFSNGLACSWAADNCPYSHRPEHRDLVVKFQTTEDESCWECCECLLIISRRLSVCPACEAPQPDPYIAAFTRVKGNISPRVDQTFQTEEDRPPGSPVGSPLRFRLDTGAEADLMDQRSACCELQ